MVGRGVAWRRSRDQAGWGVARRSRGGGVNPLSMESRGLTALLVALAEPADRYTGYTDSLCFDSALQAGAALIPVR